MLEIKLFKNSTVTSLFDSISQNLQIYRAGNFEHLLNDSSLFLASSCFLDPEKISNLDSEISNEAHCCLMLTKALTGVTSYLGRDERLWARLTHLEFINYSRARWPIPEDDEKAVSYIKKHFFARGSRGIERDNAVSRLWWMTAICAKVDNLSLEDALQTFLHQSDVRANIIERPTTSQSSVVLSAIINKLHESYADDKSLFEREKFRMLMKRINVEGGVRLLEALNYQEMKKVIDELAE